MVLETIASFAVPAAVNFLGDKFFGGGSSSSSSNSTQQQATGYQRSPLDFYAQYGAAAAAANNPLTLATSEFGNALQGSTYAQALLAQALQQGSATALADAKTRGDTATALQASEVSQLINKGLGLQEDLGKARLGVSLLGPQYMAQAATAARAGDNELAKSLAETNLGIKALQENYKGNIAQEFAKNLGTLATTRAAAQSALAQGAQRIAGQLQLGDQNIVGNLTLNKAKTESDIARIRANTAATKDLRANAVNIAMAGQRYFG
jgi:hypothetical protein|tara:strand:+ start:1676 stop:2470 length:795 start_codon:yes stop_codon:yes gene_type:complete